MISTTAQHLATPAVGRVVSLRRRSAPPPSLIIVGDNWMHSINDKLAESPPASPSFVPTLAVVDDEDYEETDRPVSFLFHLDATRLTPQPVKQADEDKSRGLYHRATALSLVNGKPHVVNFVDKAHRQAPEEDPLPVSMGEINLIHQHHNAQTNFAVEKSLPPTPQPRRTPSNDTTRLADLDDIYPIPTFEDMDISSAPTFQRRSRNRRPFRTDVFRDTISELRAAMKNATNTASKNDATFRLATFCIENCGTLLDPYERQDVKLEGIRYLLRMSKYGVPEAQYYLGKAFAEDGQYDSAFAQFQLAASDSQHPAAWYAMATCLERGKGCAVNVPLALHYYILAANAKHGLALFRYALARLKGELGASCDKTEAVRLLEEAVKGCTIFCDRMHFFYADLFSMLVADRQNPFAHFQLASILEQGLPPEILPDIQRSHKLLKTAALEYNYGPALARLARAYESGLALVDGIKDEERALRLYRRGAVESDDAECQHALSDWYLRGLDNVLESNGEQAFYWAEMAAAKGHSGSQYALGYFFENGIGTPANRETAMSWYRTAAENGNELALAKIHEASPASSQQHNIVLKTRRSHRRQKNEESKCTIS